MLRNRRSHGKPSDEIRLGHRRLCCGGNTGLDLREGRGGWPGCQHDGFEHASCKQLDRVPDHTESRVVTGPALVLSHGTWHQQALLVLAGPARAGVANGVAAVQFVAITIPERRSIAAHGNAGASEIILEKCPGLAFTD